MRDFDPARDVTGAGLILDAEGCWPNFHDGYVRTLRLWSGDMRPEDEVWTGPVLDAAIELNALEHPFLALLRFHDCAAFSVRNFEIGNDILDLTFAYRERGFRADGRTPLPPSIHVEFVPACDFALSFDCFRVEVLERRAIEPNVVTDFPGMRG